MSSFIDKTYIVFLDLPLEIQTKIDSVRIKYSAEGHKKWHSHITFKQAEDFLLSDAEISLLAINYFKNIHNIKLAITEPKIHFLANENWNIYLTISGADYLKKTIKEFSQLSEKFIDSQSPGAFGSTKWEQSNDFYPHISLKGGSSKETGEKIFNEIAKEDFKINFPVSINCESITLAKWNMNKWQELVKIKLSNVESLS